MILVVGGTGELGGRVVRLLRAQGRDVRCLVRHVTDDTTLRELGVEVARGDLTDQESLVSACRDVTTVVSTASVIARRLAGAKGPSIRAADEDGTTSLVDAAEAGDVQRFVYVSFAGADAALGTPLERAKLAIERRLGRSAMQSVVVRPDVFQEIHLGPLGRFDMAKGKVAVIGKGDTKRRWVSTDDVAALVAAVAVEPDPPSLVQLGMRLLSRRNDALASVLGAGLLQDLHEARWDDQALRQRNITATSASDFLRQQAQQLRAMATGQ